VVSNEDCRWIIGSHWSKSVVGCSIFKMLKGELEIWNKNIFGVLNNNNVDLAFLEVDVNQMNIDDIDYSNL